MISMLHAQFSGHLMDCVHSLARANVDALSEHADALEALQNILLVESRNFNWLATDDAADGFVHAARTLVSFLREQAMSLMTLASPSEHPAARAAVMQAALSILVAVAGHPAASQWLQIMPEAAQLACALQNLPPHRPEHVPLVHGGHTLKKMICCSSGTCENAGPRSDCNDSAAEVATLELSVSTSSCDPLMFQPRLSSGYINVPEGSSVCHRTSPVFEEERSDAHQVSGSHGSPWLHDCAIIEPSNTSPPQTTVIVEPCLEMYRRSRIAAESSMAASRLRLRQPIPVGFDKPLGPTDDPPVPGNLRQIWSENCQSQFSKCAGAANALRHEPGQMAAAAVPICCPRRANLNIWQDEGSASEPERPWPQDALEGYRWQPCPSDVYTPDTVHSRKVHDAISESGGNELGSTRQVKQIADAARNDDSLHTIEDETTQGFEMGYLVTGTKNTVHVRMSFDQDTQSWTVAQLQSSSVDLLGAIALQLQSLPDGSATVDRAQVNAPETCQPKLVGTVNITKSPGRLKSGSTSGRTDSPQIPEQQIIKQTPEPSTGQATHQIRESSASPDALMRVNALSLIPPGVPTNDACTQWSPGKLAVTSASPCRQQNPRLPALPNKAVSSVVSTTSTKPLRRIDGHRHSESSLASADAVTDASRQKGCAAPQTSNHTETAPMPRCHTPSPTQLLLHVTNPAQAVREQPQQASVPQAAHIFPACSPMSKHPQISTSTSPGTSRNASTLQHAIRGGQGSGQGSTLNRVEDAHHIDHPPGRPVRTTTVYGQRLSRSNVDWPALCPSTSTQLHWRPFSMPLYNPNSARPEHRRGRTHTVPCKPRSQEHSHVCHAAGPAEEPRLHSPMSAYAAAKRFGPGRRHLSAPCCLENVDRRMPPAQQLESTSFPSRENSSPKLKRSTLLKVRVQERTASASPKALWTPASHWSDLHSPMYVQQDSPSQMPHRSRLNFAERGPRHAACVFNERQANLSRVDSCDDSSSGSPLSRAASVWGCDALARALQQVENTLGRNKTSVTPICMHSSYGRQPAPRDYLGKNNLRCFMKGMQRGRSPSHELSKCMSIDQPHDSGTDARHVRERGLMSEASAQQLKHVMPCAHQLHQETKCKHVRGGRSMKKTKESFGCAAPWTDEPGVYKLEAVALRQAAQKFFRKQREADARTAIGKGISCHGRQRSMHDRNSWKRGSAENSRKVETNSRLTRNLSVSENVPVSHTHTSLARVRAAQTSRMQQRQSDLRQMGREGRT